MTDKRSTHYDPPMMIFDLYRLPDGTVIRVDATAAKGNKAIAFQVSRTKFVQAIRVAETYLDSEYYKATRDGRL